MVTHMPLETGSQVTIGDEIYAENGALFGTITGIGEWGWPEITSPDGNLLYLHGRRLPITHDNSSPAIVERLRG